MKATLVGGARPWWGVNVVGVSELKVGWVTYTNCTCSASVTGLLVIFNCL